MGALALYDGQIVEMATGEGKTLTGSLVSPMLAWRHGRVHVFTVNDYLAVRDAGALGEMYARCGCGVGAIAESTPQSERRVVYGRDIVYGTAKQITADWLRDQIRLEGVSTAWGARRLTGYGEGGVSPALVPGLRCALVDEADAVLIDEGVVPLIIAQPRREDEMSGVYQMAECLSRHLAFGTHYTVRAMRRRVDLTRAGRARAHEVIDRAVAGGASAVWRARRRAEELIRLAIVARECYRRGEHYQVVDGRIVIVDEYTGRYLADRSWEYGLHQAVEAKEGVTITADRETLARVSFQRFFRTYPFLCGMTGTAVDARGELRRVYRCAVRAVPTNRAVVRRDLGARVFATMEAKRRAIAREVVGLVGAGRAVLIGTRSIEMSELVSRSLDEAGVSHRVLNADFDAEEAGVIARAGEGGAVTVATNMAGRGTDIVLDDRARASGGLHVILTEMHSSRRIDRQLIGRSGRQGDPGSSRAMLSLEDELLRLYPPAVPSVPGGLLRADSAGELRGASRLLALRMLVGAQRRAERKARGDRAEVLKQDDWIRRHLPGR